MPFFSSPVVQSFATATYLPPPRICLRTASTCHRSDPVVHCRSATPLLSFTVVLVHFRGRSLSFSLTCRSRAVVHCRSPAHLLPFTVVLVHQAVVHLSFSFTCRSTPVVQLSFTSPPAVVHCRSTMEMGWGCSAHPIAAYSVMQNSYSASLNSYAAILAA